MLCADQLRSGGNRLLASGPGRQEHILKVIDAYERDYPNLKTRSPRYPTPAALRAISKQGETEGAAFAGVRQPTDGSSGSCSARGAADARPLYVLVWGGMEDLAQALHDAPDILPKLRVYFIGGPNKMWSVDAYNYIEQNHPKLWMIEANSTYRGWFVGGNQSGRVGQRGVRRRAREGARRARRFLRGSAGRRDQDGGQPVGRVAAARRPGGPVEARMGRQFRARLGRQEDDVHADDHAGRSGGGVRRDRVCAAGRG